MIALFLLCLISYALAVQNFEVEATNGFPLSTAISTCLAKGYCHPTLGCCSGQGKCKADNATAECVCRTCPGGVHKYTKASNCSVLANATAFADCCGTETTFAKIFHKDGYCKQRESGTYKPELGAKGRLGRHIGSPRYADGLSTAQANDSMIAAWVANLTSSSRSVAYSNYSMFTIAALQVALKDTIDWALDLNQTFTVGGKTFYKLKKQDNTGANGIAAQFENIATTAIDIGPLYDHVTRLTRSGLTLAYINETSANVYWDTYHHVTPEFLVILELYAHMHNYVLHNLEDALCGQNSLVSNFNYNGCTTWVLGQSNQDYSDYLFEMARRSTIRYSQGILEQSVLQLLIENPVNDHGQYEAIYENWFNRQNYYYTPSLTRYNQHQDFVNSPASIQTDYSQLHWVGLDHFISMRNPDLVLTGDESTSPLGDGSSCGVPVSTFARKIISLTRTPARKFGSRTDPTYSTDLEVIFRRVNELGLADYKTYVQGTTDSTDVSGLASGINVFFGSQTETNSGRRYNNALAYTIIAAGSAINWAITKDPTGYYRRIASATSTWELMFDGPTYHPLGIDTFSQDFCFGDCTDTAAYNGWNMVATATDFPNYSGYSSDARSFGALFAQPNPGCYLFADLDQGYSYHGSVGYTQKYYCQGSIWGETVSSLFYQFDGLNTYPFRLSDQTDYFLVNPISDAIPMTFSPSLFDGLCYTQSVIDNNCNRVDTVQWMGISVCEYTWW